MCKPSRQKYIYFRMFSGMLIVDPSTRFSIDQVYSALTEIADSHHVAITPLVMSDKSDSTSPTTHPIKSPRKPHLDSLVINNVMDESLTMTLIDSKNDRPSSDSKSESILSTSALSKVFMIILRDARVLHW